MPWLAAGDFKVLDKLGLTAVRAEIEKPHARDESVLAARAAAQHILGIQATAAIDGRDRLDRLDAGQFLDYPIGPVVIDGLSESI